MARKWKDPCPDCEAYGLIEDETCERCEGSGQITWFEFESGAGAAAWLDTLEEED